MVLSSLVLLTTVQSSVVHAAGECPASVAGTVTWTYTGGNCLGVFVASTSWTPPAGVTSIDYYVVGGGGGGGALSNQFVHSGGAGGAIASGTKAIGATAITVTVGSGGAQNAAGSASTLVQSATTLVSAAGGATNSNAGSGVGTGTTSSFSGSSVVYSAKGGGTGQTGGTNAGNGAPSGDCGTGGSDAVANTGAGGGAGGGGNCYSINFYTTGGKGGSGIVMVKYVAFGVTSFTTTSAALVNSRNNLTYTLTFVSAVDATTLTAEDISNGGTAGCTFSTSPTTGSSTTFTVIASGCVDGTVIPTLASGSVTSSTAVSGPGAAYPGTTVTIDTTAPNAPTLVDLATASDTGTSSTDNATKTTTPTMSATGGATGDTATITATNGSTTKSCTYVLPATSCTLPALTDGTWSVASSLTDPAGNVSPSSAPLDIVIDTTAPTASTPDLLAATDTGTSSTDNLTNSTSPQFTMPGTSIGDTVTMSAVNGGTTKTCSYVVTASVNSCAMTGVTAGTWSVTGTAMDPAGNTSPASSALSLVVDTTAPSAPGTPDLATASDTGTSSTDNTTSDNTPTMSSTGGTAGDTMTITATQGATTESCTYVLPATSCDLPALSDGTWSIASTLTDPAGNTSTASSPLSIVIDGAPPTAPGSAPDLLAASDSGSSSTDNITSDNTPTIAGVGGATGETVTVSATNGSTTLSCSYVVPATSCTLPTLTDGTWNVSNTVTDLSGNVSTAGPALPLVIDTSAPTAPSAPDLNSSSDLGNSSTDNLTSDNTPTLSATGGTTGDTMTITATNGGTTKSCSYVVGVATSCDLPTLSDGTWSVTSTLTDPSGNVSSASSPLSMVIDTSAPSAPSSPDLISASDLGASSTDNLTNDSTPTMSVTGGATGDVATITATKGGTSVSCTYVIGTATSCDLPSLSDGTWSVTSTLTDPAGNVSPASSPLSLQIDTTPPTTPGSAPDLLAGSDTGTSSTDNITSDNTPTIAGVGGATGETVTVNATKGSTTLSCSYVVPATSCTLPALTDGTWNVSNTVTDTAGNVSAAGPSVPIVIDTTVPAAPSVPDLVSSSDLGTLSTDNVTADNTPAISAVGVSNGDTITVSATSGGITKTCSYVVGVAASCDLPTLSDGTWSVTTTAIDPAGNTSTASSPLSLVIDTVAPASAPSIPDLLASSDLGTSSTDNLTSDNTPAMSAAGGVTGETITISATKGGVTLSCSYVIGVATSCDLPTLSDGTWNVTSTLTDIAGNTSIASAPLSLVIDTTPPTAPTTAPDLDATSDSGESTTDNYTSGSTPQINVTGGVTGELVTVTATKGALVASCTFVVGSATSCNLPQLTDGVWSVTSTFTDLAGAVSAPSPILQLTVDTVPTVLGTPDLTDASDTGDNAKDNVTADSTPTISNPKAVAGDIVTVIAISGNQTLTCTFTVPTETSCTLPKLSDGKWTITNEVKDLAGNISVTSPLLIIVMDSTLPPAKEVLAANVNAQIVHANTVRSISIVSKKLKVNFIGRKIAQIVYFDPTSDALDKWDTRKLDAVAKVIARRSGVLYITGFARQNLTDTSEYLKDLSIRRAHMVAKYLAAHGVTCRIKYDGLGATTPWIGTPMHRKVELRWSTAG